jgi:putative tricarboxylic transport membrane protein
MVICFVLLTTYYLYESFYINPTLQSDFVGPSLFPQLIAILALILSAIYFFQLRKRGAVEAGEESASFRDELSNLAPLAPILLYVLILEPVGFLISTAIYVFIAMLVYGRAWREALVYAVTFSIGFFVLFYYALLANVPMGWFLQTERLLPFLVQLRRAIGG